MSRGGWWARSAAEALFIAMSCVSCSFPSYEIGGAVGVAGSAGAGGTGQAGSGGDGGQPSAGFAGSAGASVASASASAGAGGGGEPEPAAPTGIQLSAGEKVVHVSQVGGTAYTDACPTGQVLIGLQSTTDEPDSVVRSVRGLCGQLTVQPGAESGTYEVRMSSSSLLPERGPVASSPQAAACPANGIMTGFSGRSAGVINALEIRCVGLEIVGSGDEFSVFVSGEAAAGTIGGPGGNGFGVTECPDDQIAVGQVIEANQALTAFGLVCATPSVVLQ